MPVPDDETLMAPALAALTGGEPRTAGEVRDAMAGTVTITDENRQQRLKSGERLFDSRVH